MTSVADFGLTIGSLAKGPTNSVLDVPGVGLGHTTIVRDEPAPPAGRGVARTGVTVLDLGGNLWESPVAAGGSVLNGAGECTGFLSAGEWGLVESPIYLTSTMQLGRVYDAACRIALAEEPRVADEVIIPVVGECDDSWLSAAGSMHVEFEDVVAARAAARASIGTGIRPATGAVGAGTGMLCLGWKGGVGTSSRVVEGGHVVAVLLLTNFGQADRLTVAGVPVGRILGRSGYDELPGTEFHHPHPGPAAGDRPGSPEPSRGPRQSPGAPVAGTGSGGGGPAPAGSALPGGSVRGPAAPPPAGSCLGIVVTDAPLDPHGCRRLATRIGLGLGRTGTTAHHASGEIFLGVSVGMRAARGRRPGFAGIGGAELDPLFEACVDATEEAVLDALLNAHDVVGRGGHRALALPHDALRAALA